MDSVESGTSQKHPDPKYRVSNQYNVAIASNFAA
jgi:hypothetical protein